MISKHIYQQTLRKFFYPITILMDDPEVTEILINGYDKIVIEKNGRLEPTAYHFQDAEELLCALRHLSQYSGRPLGPGQPILEGTFPDGSRVEAVLPPIAIDGPYVAIRKFSTQRLNMEMLIQKGALSQDTANLLYSLIQAKKNILVSGGTGSGKTSLLNALASYIDPNERIVVLEDAKELQLQRADVVQLEARRPDQEGQGGISIRDLFKATLRLRPDRIVIGEIRGGEAIDLVQAMTSGHGGCMSTLHATSVKDTLSRLETMALMSGVELPLLALRSQISSAIDIVVQTSRFSDGSRGITSITKVLDLSSEGTYQIQDLFIREKQT